MLTKKQIAHINDIIDDNYDDIILKFYPEYNVKSDNKIISLNLSNKQLNKLNNLMNHVKKNGIVSEIKQVELNIKDTFMRCTNDNNIIYFKRKTLMFETEKKNGIFLLELYKKCIVEDFPHILDYHYRDESIITTYNLNNYQVNYTQQNNSYSININFNINKNNIEQSLISILDILNNIKKTKLI